MVFLLLVLCHACSLNTDSSQAVAGLYLSHFFSQITTRCDQESLLFQNCSCSCGKAPWLVLQGLSRAPES